MRRYITIDGGTTNTRIFLVEDGEVKDSVKLSVGTRAAIDDKNALMLGIKRGLDSLIKKRGLCEADIIAVIASGMITSEFGLCPLPHITAPAGIAELNKTMHKTSITDISGIPFYFIRGVRLVGDSAFDTDMMRGEETELMGIIKGEYIGALYVLPGSHSKHISLNADGYIVDFSTHMTGEMIHSLSQYTILKDAVDLRSSEIDIDHLVSGYELCERVGIIRAIFKTRVLKHLLGKEPSQCYSFFLGVVLHDEIRDIIASPTYTVIVGGRAQIRAATSILLRVKSDKRVIELTDREVDCSVACGAVKIFEYS